MPGIDIGDFGEIDDLYFKKIESKSDGKNEVENKEVNIRRFGSKDQFSKSLDEFYNYVVDEAAIKFDK